MHNIQMFIAHFDRICGSFMDNLQQERPINMELFMECWKIWTVLRIIKYNEVCFCEIYQFNNFNFSMFMLEQMTKMPSVLQVQIVMPPPIIAVVHQ
jgi:hypothetical protein